MQPYSPFDKHIREIRSDDLKNLKQASEGWYIEYKREMPNAAALAKSISAFANTYGGWLFIGVEEESKEKSVAGAFPGLQREDVDSSLQRLRKSVADHLNPTPHFETKVLWGPNSEVELADNHAVICVWIPQSVSAPHVHKAGHIYRRVSDGSEPRPENDRFVLDQLWRRADELKRYHREWYGRDPEFSKDEKEFPYLRLMLIADRWSERDVWIDSDESEVRAALGETAGAAGSIPFDNVYTFGDGFIGRQLNGNNPHNLSLTWSLRRNLISDVIIPLHFFQPARIDLLNQDLHGYENVQCFVDFLKKRGVSTPRIVDLNYVFNALIGVAEIQERLCSLAGWSESYFLKVKLLNSWRTIPFVDIPEVLDRFERFGPPMCMDSVAAFPRPIGPDHYIEIARNQDVENQSARILIQALLMFSPIALLYGIPRWSPFEEADTLGLYLTAWQKAGARAVEVQRLRNARQKG